MKNIAKSALLYSTIVSASQQPNVVVILADDLGWKDTAITGSNFYETPAIDALAKDGKLFKNAYAPHPVCGPSRASILTGKAPLRIKNTGIKGNVNPNEVTLGEAFKKAGYATFFTGKWHCGMGAKHPSKQGFEQTIAVNSQGQPGSFYYPYKDTGMDWPGLKRKVIKSRDVPNLEGGKPGEYLTDRLTNETVNFIKKNKDRPFLAYLSHYAVHAPLESKKKYEDYFRKKAAKLPTLKTAYTSDGKTRFKQRQDNPIFAGMIKSLDDSVAGIVNCLKEQGIYDDTIIIFSSDNGGIASLQKDKIDFSTSNLPSRAGKGWNYEGGVKVPLIISYPKKVKGGETDEIAVGTDFYPTLLELAGLPAQPEQHKDGKSLVPALNGGTINRDTLCWFFPQAHGSGHKPSAAIRYKNMKLIHFLKDDRLELYDLSKDVGEQKDLSQVQPEMAVELKKKLTDWRKKMQNNR